MIRVPPASYVSSSSCELMEAGHQIATFVGDDTSTATTGATALRPDDVHQILDAFAGEAGDASARQRIREAAML